MGEYLTFREMELKPLRRPTSHPLKQTWLKRWMTQRTVSHVKPHSFTKDQQVAH